MLSDNATVTGSQYLRQCESKKYAQALIAHELQIHGNNYANFATLLCDDDGSYGAYRVQSSVYVKKKLIIASPLGGKSVFLTSHFLCFYCLIIQGVLAKRGYKNISKSIQDRVLKINI